MLKKNHMKAKLNNPECTTPDFILVQLKIQINVKCVSLIMVILKYIIKK